MSSHAHLLPRYQALRKVGQGISRILVERFSKVTTEEGARALGILKRGVLVFDSEEEMPILMDYCMYDVRLKGRNVIEKYLAESPPPAGSDELLVLESMLDARFGFFIVEEVERGVGVLLRDANRGETFFLFDIGLGTSAEPGLVMVSRIKCPDNIHMTTGAALPLGVVPEKEWAGLLDKFALGDEALSPEQRSERNAAILRTCLQRGAASHVAFRDPTGGLGRAPRSLMPPSERPLLPATRTERVGRNDPCPCGSGKKFKQCCARKS